MKMKNIGLAGVGLSLFLGVLQASAVDSLCAEVQIEIQQEATLVRQGFDAHMTINNGLPSTALENISVEVTITDADENPVTTSSETTNTTAAFYVGVDYTENITNKTVAASTSADLHWLIIPTLNAGVSNQWGDVFYVGATLTYTIDGKEETVEVTPDSIVVKPLPELKLDYFLPETVYGLDPMTGEGEVVPFSLGVLVQNTGYGSAESLVIDSAQPEIVQNTNGLLVSFTITGTEVNGETTANSLLVDFGTVDPGGTALARWTMECSLFGKFTEFSADFSHADELGGMLTSLIQSNNISTHTLVHDVKVDLSGRDDIRDFLSDEMIVYESDGTIAAVTNISSSASMSGSMPVYTISGISSEVSGPVYFSNTLSLANMSIEKVERSDGKQIESDNAWISKRREMPTDEWLYAFNLFDVNPEGGSYTVYFDMEASTNVAPIWTPVGTQDAYVGQMFQLAVHATDLNSTVPELTVKNAPGEAGFDDYGNGYGYFYWTPDSTGTETVTFIASDQYTNSQMSVDIVVQNLSIPSGYPAWWYEHGIIATNADVNDYAPVNQGQLKYMAWAAYKEMEQIHGGTNGNGGALFTLTATNNAYNYYPVNIGQAKTIAAPFYDRLGMDYPWNSSSNSANDFAMVNIGQVKNLFSFDPLRDSDNDGMPDWWEGLYSEGITNMLPNADANDDGISNREAYFNNIIP